MLRSEGRAHVLLALDDVPFDRASGVVLLACQQHYVREHAARHGAEPQVRALGGAQTSSLDMILHRFAALAGVGLRPVCAVSGPSGLSS